MDPMGGLVRGFEIAEFGDQSLAQRFRLVRGQHDPRRPDHLTLPTSAHRGERQLINHRLRRRLNIETGCRTRVPPAARSGASRSSSPAIPTRVNNAYRRA